MPGPGGPTGLLEGQSGAGVADGNVGSVAAIGGPIERYVDLNDIDFADDEDGERPRNPCAEEIKVSKRWF